MNTAKRKHRPPHHVINRYRIPGGQRRYMVCEVCACLGLQNAGGVRALVKPTRNQRTFSSATVIVIATHSDGSATTCSMQSPPLHCSRRVVVGRGSRTPVFPDGCLGLHICASVAKMVATSPACASVSGDTILPCVLLQDGFGLTHG